MTVWGLMRGGGASFACLHSKKIRHYIYTSSHLNELAIDKVDSDEIAYLKLRLVYIVRFEPLFVLNIYNNNNVAARSTAQLSKVTLS